MIDSQNFSTAIRFVVVIVFFVITRNPGNTSLCESFMRFLYLRFAHTVLTLDYEEAYGQMKRP